jgi:beta-galactosidase
LKRFTAQVGLDDEKRESPHGSVIVRVLGDGRELYVSPVITIQGGPIVVEVDISGVQELLLVTEDAKTGLDSNHVCDDHVSWADPRVE